MPLLHGALALVLAGATPAPPAPLTPIDTAATELPAGFAGHDYRRVFALYADKGLAPKGEFETTEQYERRLAEAASGTHYGFALPAAIEYSADTQTFTCQITIDRDRLGTSGLVWLHKLTRQVTGTYVGGNAFGAKTTVTKMRFHELGIRTPASKISRDRTAAYLEVPVPLERAAAVKATLAILLVCKVAPDDDGQYVVEGTDFSAASMDDPVDAQYSFRYINCVSASLWAYDTKTGAVHLRTDLARR